MIDNIFQWGYNKNLDETSTVIRRYHNYLDVMLRKVSDLIPKGKGALMLHKKYTEASGYYFEITTKRLADVNQALKAKSGYRYKVEGREFEMTHETFRSIRTTKDKARQNVLSDDLEEISEVLEKEQKSLRPKICQVYTDFLFTLVQNYEELQNQMSRFVAELDFYKTAAQTSLQYNYCCPTLQPDQPSFVRVIKMRHPLIEQINLDTTYIPHDLQLGTHYQPIANQSTTNQSTTNQSTTNQSTTNQSTTNQSLTKSIPNMNGMLLYGANACGKSSMMKAIGINVILAQSGLFVAADQFILSPYSQILTRILGNDNIHRSLSSFAVEMTELRGILSRANPSSLVLGDEICHSTETYSGVALVASGIVELLEHQGAQFIFATHLHQLTELPEITNLPDLGIYHLRVNFDRERHHLTYDRTLHPGSGDALYGIEVARAMDLPERFLTHANRIRQQIVNQSEQILSPTPSRYNARRYGDECEICQERKDDWHHIAFQCTADENGFIGHFHKNHDRNLVPVCKSCHQRIHSNDPHDQIKINGYKITSEGIKLDYSMPQPATKSLAKPSTKHDLVVTQKLKTEPPRPTLQLNFRRK